MDYSPALERLQNKLKSKDLETIIQNELRMNKRFSLYDQDSEMVIHFNHGEKGPATLNVGFPFPLYSEEYGDAPDHLGLNIFIRGEPVRNIQREMLKNLVSYTEVDGNLHELLRGADKNRAIFVDPYNFIGDSFIGLHFLDSVGDYFGIKSRASFSDQHAHLKSTLESVEPYEVSSVVDNVRDGDLVIVPDLIDSHWEKTLDLINSLKGENLTMILPGRELLIDFNGGDVRAYHARKEDTLLINQNIEDYMNSCLDIFGIPDGSLSVERLFFGETSKFFLNPFASVEERYISPNLMFGVYQNLKDLDGRSEFYLISDYHHNPAHISWLNEFLELMRSDQTMRRVSINYYSDLNELAEHMNEKECGAVLSADTSISHLANRLGFPCVTLYNRAWWDENSLQSLSASSPAGFCRYVGTQIPIINDSYTSSEMMATSKLIATTMLFAQKSSVEKRKLYQKDESGWIDQIYDPSQIVRGVSLREGNEPLISAAEKVSLRYKLENDC